MTAKRTALVKRLLERGDRLAISKGRLEIVAFSGKPIPNEWLNANRTLLIKEILELARYDGLVYSSFSTGYYEVGNGVRSSGVTAQFENLTTGQLNHTIFNAELTRQRTTTFGRKGDPLPNGHFRISNRHGLYRFWLVSGLPFPRRLAALNEYMGNLKQLVFTCNSVKYDPTKQGRIPSWKDIYPLTITHDQMLLSLERDISQPDTSRTTDGHPPNNFRTTRTDKLMGLPPLQQGPQPNLSACPVKGDISKQNSTYTRSNIFPIHSPSREAQDQSVEDWMSDLGP